MALNPIPHVIGYFFLGWNPGFYPDIYIWNPFRVSFFRGKKIFTVATESSSSDRTTGTLFTAKAWAAKASLASMRSKSFTVQPTWEDGALGVATLAQPKQPVGWTSWEADKRTWWIFLGQKIVWRGWDRYFDSWISGKRYIDSWISGKKNSHVRIEGFQNKSRSADPGSNSNQPVMEIWFNLSCFKSVIHNP